MIDVKNIDISDKFGLEYLYITFSINDTTDPIEKYIFNLYRSNNQSAAFSMIASDLPEFKHKDYAVNLYNPMINYYYKVEIIDKETKESSFSPEFQFKKGVPDKFALAILDIESKYLNYVIDNDEMILLQKKRTGQICDCYDDVRKTSNNSHCEKCFGTGYVGGYYSPQRIKVNFYNAPSKQFKYSPTENVQDLSTIQLWTPNFPLIENEDILIDKNNVRYIVISNNPTIKNYYIIRQILAMQMIPKYNVIYEYKV